jgi:uncharacterized membrane protein YgdD (TMEM256/DUF423 family)
MKKTLVLAAIFMALAIAIGAFGAHALKAILEQNQTSQIFETASKYLFYQTLGLFILAFLIDKFPEINYSLIIRLHLIGTLIFSFSLFTLAITNIRWLGAITPLGGIFMISAWVMLAFKLRK